MSLQNVSCTVTDVTIPTYEPQAPDPNPMYLEKRVYQGSSGAVYPLPVYNRISSEPTDRKWQAIILENQFIEVMILPEIGGRIHTAKDKTNGYDFIYRQSVIKPALVGLAGPWISGGIEFNWPQHHRPATFMPVNYEVENHADGSITVWLSDHDPIQRMKGMHGVCLHPDRSVIELKVRAYNRTDCTQTFLWWANVATRVHEQYQSFFPPDVHYVADHAKRATSSYPLCDDHYYGVDYGKRGREGVPSQEVASDFIPPHCTSDKDGDAVDYAPNDLSWYANIPVPTSYMCMGTDEDFFGGYDHGHRAGLVHVANHHIAPGKKQWTWGNHDFGYAWDRNLTDEDGPYIELMAGVYTDNQPDFSFLMPGETKTWSQYWYPIQSIGVPKQADMHHAVRLVKTGDTIELGVAATAESTETHIELSAKGQVLLEKTVDIGPSSPFTASLPCPIGVNDTDLCLVVSPSNGRNLTYAPQPESDAEVPDPATEPPRPETVNSTDELYITGLHLDQYRHATRSPVEYWQEALTRDPQDSRCNNAMGLWYFNRGEFATAIDHFNAAIGRLTTRNPNPLDGEPYYNLGRTFRMLGDLDAAYAAFYKSAWNMAWQAPAYHAIAEIDCRNQDWHLALEHIDKSLRYNYENLRARNLKLMILQKLGRVQDADALLSDTLALDPLDWWARMLRGDNLVCDSQTRIDLALDLHRAGFDTMALKLLLEAKPEPFSGTGPTLFYLAAWIDGQLGNTEKAEKLRDNARSQSPDYCFPFRLEELQALEAATKAGGDDARARFYMGNLLYSKRRHADALVCWRQSTAIEPANAVAWRNIGIGAYNADHDEAAALDAFKRAMQEAPEDSRLLYECDQLWKRTGKRPSERINQLEAKRSLVKERDDLSLEYCTLLNQVGRPVDAQKILSSRQFQPWEGGEGTALGQHVRSNLLLGRRALDAGEAEAAKSYVENALTSPHNLGEAKHLLANQSDIYYWLGCALEGCGEANAAREVWNLAAEFKGDFQNMEVRAYSEMTYYSALSLEKLGRDKEAKSLLNGLLEYARELEQQDARIDYFATSLPTLLLFDEDIQFNQVTTGLFLQAQAKLGLGDSAAANQLLHHVLERSPNHPLAQDLLDAAEGAV